MTVFKTKIIKTRLIFCTFLFFVFVGNACLAEGIYTDKPKITEAKKVKFNSVSPLKVEEFDIHKARLGKKLFFDKILSENNNISCATCHIIENGGAMPGMQFAPEGVDGKAVNINIPTVFNSSKNYVQFWDGRASNLKNQIDGPILNSSEMGMKSWSKVEEKISQNPEYKKLFLQIYNSKPTEANIKNAIVEYEKSLVTPDSKFDKYLNGDESAITEEQKKGFELFNQLGCVSCHQGENLGGNMLQKFGFFGDYFADRGDINELDYGHFNVTKNPDDKFVFKVPSLRNVALTSPYFHDGSANTLEEAVSIMAKYQLGVELSKDDKKAIVAFLETLSGNVTDVDLEEDKSKLDEQ
jgi:cytochrome c peroxidase